MPNYTLKARVRKAIQILRLWFQTEAIILLFMANPDTGSLLAGYNVYDVEIGGVIVSSYNDGFLLSQGLYKGYTAQYSATVSNGLLQFNGRIRELDSAGYGMSLSLLTYQPGESVGRFSDAPYQSAPLVIPGSTRDSSIRSSIWSGSRTPAHDRAITGSLRFALSGIFYR